MKKNSKDIFASDIAFISFGGAMLTGIGLVMLVLSLLCRFGTGGGLCEIQLVSFPRLHDELLILSDDFISVNLPLGMLIIGIGLQLFTKLGWLVSFFVLVVFALIFGASLMVHQGEWREMGLDYVYVKPVILHLCFFLITMASIFYLFSTAVRRLYW